MEAGHSGCQEFPIAFESDALSLSPSHQLPQRPPRDFDASSLPHGPRMNLKPSCEVLQTIVVPLSKSHTVQVTYVGVQVGPRQLTKGISRHAIGHLQLLNATPSSARAVATSPRLAFMGPGVQLI